MHLLGLLLLLALGGAAYSTVIDPRAVVEVIELQGRQLQDGNEASDNDYVEAGAQTAVSVSGTAYDERPGDARGCGDDGCLPALAYDGVSDDYSSRWSCAKKLVPDGGQCEIMFSFESPQDIMGMNVSFFKGDERTRWLKVTMNGEKVGEFESTAGAITTFYDIQKNHVHTVTLESIGLDIEGWISLIEVNFMVAPVDADDDPADDGGIDDDDTGLTCEGEIPGIQQDDVCCPTSCGSCAGTGCTERNGGDTFTGREACCGGGVRSLGRVCSAEVGAPCVVAEDMTPAPTPVPTTAAPVMEDITPALTTWQFNGTELTFSATAAWGAVMTFEIPDSEGEVAEFYFSTDQERLEEILVGAELFRIDYDDDEEIVDIVLQSSGSRRALEFQFEAHKDNMLPAWTRPSTLAGAMASGISCDNCNDIIDVACYSAGAMCGTALVSRNLATGVVISALYGVSIRILQTVIPAFRFACAATGALCTAKLLAGATDVVETCEDIFCCGERSRCGIGCYQESTERCCGSDVISNDECCPDETECADDGSCVSSSSCCPGQSKCGEECFDPDVSVCCEDGPITAISITCPTPFPTPAPATPPPSPATPPPTPPTTPPPAPATPPPAPTPTPGDDGKTGGYSLGDPHMQTFDGINYDCQGQGEFLLTKAASTESEVQARFQPWSTGSAVTVTTGVVAREGNSSVVQVTLADSGSEVAVLVDGEPYDETAGLVTGVVLDVTSSRVEMFFPSGMDIYVSARYSLLAVYTYAPLTLNTTGLLGNNNGEIEDEWMTADGEIVAMASPGRPTVAEGTNYCITNWCTTQDTSIFTYVEGEDHSTYALCDAAGVYVAPVLPDPIPPAIIELCGDNAACIFDAILAGEDVGRSTLEEIEANRVFQEEVGGLCATNSFSSTGKPPCASCPSGEVSGTGATACFRLPVLTTKSFSVEVPELNETSVDFGLLVDVSGSYSDDIARLKILASELVNGLATNTSDLQLALGTFVDFPTSSDSSDVAYTLVKNFGSCDDSACFEEEKAIFVEAIDTLSADGGGDIPESQTVALFNAATEWLWRQGVVKVLAITTDAPFHVLGDGSPNEDQYYSLDEIISACNDKTIKILALKAPGAEEEMDAIAEGTGGVVETTRSDSADIVDAILVALAGLKYQKVEVDWICEDSSWAITVDPSDGYEEVDGGTTLNFTVAVTVPIDAIAATTCAANVQADEVLVGGQEFTVNADGSVTVTAVRT